MKEELELALIVCGTDETLEELAGEKAEVEAPAGELTVTFADELDIAVVTEPVVAASDSKTTISQSFSRPRKVLGIL